MAAAGSFLLLRSGLKVGVREKIVIDVRITRRNYTNAFSVGVHTSGGGVLYTMMAIH